MHYVTFFVEHIEAQNTLPHESLDVPVVFADIYDGTLGVVVKQLD
jgi:hypothetical protein